MKNKKPFLLILSFLMAFAAFAGHDAPPAYPNFGMPRVEEMMFLVLQIGVIIFAARLGGWIVSKMRLPSILGELAAGIVIGPWALGGIGFGEGIFQYGLFNGVALKAMNAPAVVEGAKQVMFGTTVGGKVMFDATSPALYGIATLASVILLFLSGLETNLKLFLRFAFSGTLVGLGGVIVSFVFGDLCAVYLLPQFFEHFRELATLPLAQAMTREAPLYMGIMSTATSVGITARILSERKKMDSEEGVTIMAGAVIDDVLGLIVLAIGNGIIAANIVASRTGSTTGMNWGNIGLVAAKAFGVWLGATVIGCLAARKIAKCLKFAFKEPVVIATMAFGLSLVLAGFFEYMGLAMIIGAYVMGLALSRTDLKHTIQETLMPVYTFLVPVFFCVMGMMVDITALCSRPVLMFGLIYTILAVAAKVIGCMIPSICCGFNILGGLRIGAGMVPRGEVALIIAGLGLSYGYLTQEIFGIGIMMTLITTIVAPPALVGLFSSNRKGVRHEKDNNQNSRLVTFELSSPTVAEVMLDKIVAQFQKEDFFTSLLSKELSLWSIAKDKMEISIKRRKHRILVECTPAEEAVVMTAWMEVVSEINDLAKHLSKPVRQDDSMSQMLGDISSSVKTSDSVGKYLQEFVMLPVFKASSKHEAIEKMVREIARSYPETVKNADEALAAVLRREDSMPTGLDCGIAVPHGRTDSVSRIVGAVALVDNSENENGTIADYETIDHSAVKILVLTLAPEKTQTPYLQLMSFISRALKSNNRYEQLIGCKTKEEMRKFFRETN